MAWDAWADDEGRFWDLKNWAEPANMEKIATGDLEHWIAKSDNDQNPKMVLSYSSAGSLARI